MKAFPKLLILALLATTMMACASTSWRGEDISKYKGEMTYHQAVKKWGAPDSKKRLKNGNLVAKWNYTNVYMLPRNFPTYRPSGSYFYTPYLDMQMTRQTVTEKLILTFNKNDILTNWQVD